MNNSSHQLLLITVEMICRAHQNFGTLEYQIKPIPELLLSAEGVYVGSYWINDANTQKYDGHTVLNLRANYRKRPMKYMVRF